MWVKWPNAPTTSTTTRTTVARTPATKATMSTARRGGSSSSSSCRRSAALAALLLIVALAAPQINGFRTIELNSGEGRKLFGGYRITPKHCRATRTLPLGDPRANGQTICMFNHECAQRNGEVVGACMDGFLFGACCQLPESQAGAPQSTLIKDAQNTYYQQQLKLQAQQAVSNPAAAQSYETYGESSLQQQQQQQQEEASGSGNYPTTQPHDIFEQENLDKVYQQLETGSGASNYGSSASTSSYTNASPSAGGVSSSSSSSSGSYTNNATPSNSYTNGASASSSYAPQSTAASSIEEQQPLQQQSIQQQQQQNDPQDISNSEQEEEASASTDSGQSSSQELENEAQLNVNAPAAATNSLVEKRPPPEIHVHKNSVKVSSPSSPPHNDDFVMQVLSTLPPDHESDHITFTTEVPMKIASSLVDQTSSESNSFEEERVTQLPVKLVDRPSTSQVKKDEAPHKQPAKPQNTHHHNHLVLSDTEFTHSSITHPGADADLVEDDLQFSTGYGPQPVYVESPAAAPPKQSNDADGGYNTAATAPPANDENYVLVQTITNQQQQQPSKTAPANGAPTTSAAITTHVDSIESIILQLNSSNHGPTYNVVNQQQQQQTPAYGSDAETDSEPQGNGYYDNSTPGALIATPTSPPKYYEEIETKRPENLAYLQDELQGGSQSQYGGVHTAVSQVPAYLEPVTTNLNLNAEAAYDTAGDEKDDTQQNAYMQNAYPSPRPAVVTQSSPAPSYGNIDEGVQVLDEHTMPESSYDDSLAAAGHLTSEFNKMPAVGIAYPVDMAYIEEEETGGGNGGYADSSTAQPLTPLTNAYPKTPDQPELSYTRRPATTVTESRPIASYIGVVTSQNYNQQSPVQIYNQVPSEVSVSSYTTKVQEDAYDTASSASYDSTSKLTTASYAESTTAAPVNVYISSTSVPLAARPQYDSYAPVSSSTLRPVLITASNTKAKPRPRPSTKRPTKRPSTSGTSTTSTTVSGTQTKKTSKPQAQRKPAPQPSNVYNQDTDTAPSNNYNQQLKKPATQPSNNYNSSPTKNKTKRPTAAPSSSSYQPQADYSNNQPTPTYAGVSASTKRPPAYNQEPSQPTLSYNQHSHKTKKPAYQLEYTSARPTASALYAQQQQLQQHLQGVKTPVLQPSSLTYNQEQHVSTSPPAKRTSTRKPTTSVVNYNNYGNNKKPATGKPISTSYVTGPTTPRPPTTFVYHDNEVPPLLVADDKLDAFVQSTAASAISVATPSTASYQAPVYVSSVTPLNVDRPHNPYNKPGFVKVQHPPTDRPPMPTVLITPKPTVINLVTSSSWTQQPSGGKTPIYGPTTPLPAYGGSSYVYSPLVTRRPGGTPSYVSISPVTSNDFDDPGYFGMQSSSSSSAPLSPASTYAVPVDDRPAFPGYYGPTPTYPTYVVPGEKLDSPIEEETYTSPNDFVNFPPVRNPNLNMSAASSAVTTDLELSTPAFVEDGVLKDKMNTLVHKIVESLQDNFDALAELIDETNVTAPAPTLHYQPGSATVTRKPTRKPTRVTTATSSSARPKPATTKRPPTRVSTRKPASSPTTSRKPVTQRRPSTTRKPTTRRPATKKPTTVTTAASVEDDLVDEEDGDDINNEIDQTETLSSAPAAGGRKLQCGVRPQVKSGRIVGGKGSTFGAFPWQVLVRESTWLGLFTKNKCGGVLITNRYVITAAHCQPGFLASLVAVMGEYDISGELEDKRAVTKNVKRVIVHRQYDPATFENDLALLELDNPVQYDTHIVPICMPLDTADFTGRMATVTGWGRLKYGGGVPSVLQEVQVPIIENSVCQEMFHTAGHNKKILGSFLCAGYANGQKDSCEGDSGGPLVLQRPDGRYELAGTVSHGIKCAAPYLPGVYMRTTFYKPWLRSITGVK